VIVLGSSMDVDLGSMKLLLAAEGHLSFHGLS